MGLMYKTENHLMGYIGVATIVHVHHSKIMSEESTHIKKVYYQQFLEFLLVLSLLSLRVLQGFSAFVRINR